jgi:hypothetical protein
VTLLQDPVLRHVNPVHMPSNSVILSTINTKYPGGREVFHIRPDRLWSRPSFLYNGYRVPGVKRPGRVVYHPAPSSAEVEEKVQLFLYTSCGPSWPVLGRTLQSTREYKRSPPGEWMLVLCVVSKDKMQIIKTENPVRMKY